MRHRGTTKPSARENLDEQGRQGNLKQTRNQGYQQDGNHAAETPKHGKSRGPGASHENRTHPEKSKSKSEKPATLATRRAEMAPEHAEDKSHLQRRPTTPDGEFPVSRRGMNRRATTTSTATQVRPATNPGSPPS
jgi:hypothetical protein